MTYSCKQHKNSNLKPNFLPISSDPIVEVLNCFKLQ